ncbi:uncharacterized protein LOC127634614 isoform X1 [Xyrauchen texanus]|uniref:uncharacterized protein LOC127634614 isoform X1 n=1 Tax=Xyrauchen texanus TaxID=154827 RepID=UPI002241E723|nr:uncharacterized protein LOC127634614 isoform X1 [Xyrauchen texanus]XP_051970191.1 uncharacterized protein LOC127634614 isoform X1 [Xyrauchen texanus]
MADSKELVPCDTTITPEFIKELLPSAERTALLYHLSYLCLGKFPKLERLLRQRAVETQLLFGSSEALLLKCVGVSSNLVTSLFPMLMRAIEKDKPLLAVKYLEKARSWINDIVRAVGEMVTRYDQHNYNVASSTSDVITEKIETETKLKQTSAEIEVYEKSMAELMEKLNQNIKSIEGIDRKIAEKNTEMQEYTKEASKKRQGFGIMASIVPFIGPVIKSIHDAVNEPGVAAKTQGLTNELAQLMSEKNSLRNQEWGIYIRQTDLELKLASCKINMGAIPSPVHLGEVQRCLSQIQKILIQLKVFWEKVGTLLECVKEKTFVGEDLIDDPDMKEDFLKSIDMAGKCWTSFRVSCEKAQGMFSVQSRDAYKFLEISVSSLSQKEWNEQYQSLIEKMKSINPESVEEPKPAAITP